MFGGMRKTTVAGWSVGSAYASLKSEGRSPWRFRQGWCAFAFAILTAARSPSLPQPEHMPKP